MAKVRIRRRKPIIVYASSLIQQNHGEDIKGHGWCDWEVASRTFQFHELPNDYGYYTLRIEDGVVPPLENMPKNARLRIFAGDLDATEIKKLVASIRVNHTVTELAVNRLPTVGKTKRGVDTGTILDIQNVDYQNKLITEYLHNTASEIAPDVLDRVLKINADMNDQITSDDPTRKLVWTPISLKFSNLFTYGEDNYINFKDLQGVVGLFAPNASGKSSIPDAICFALYDKTPRTNRAANIMNTRATTCSVEFRFEIDGFEYIVKRKGTKNAKGEVKVDVALYRVSPGGIKVNLTGEQRKDTNAIIREYVGDFEDFVLTAFSSQSNNSLFIDRGQADRKDMLSQFMGLTIFDKLHLLATEESKSTHAALKRFEKDDFTEDLVAVQDELTELKRVSTEKDNLLTFHRQEFGSIESQINELYANKLPVSVSNANIGELERSETRLMNDITQLKLKRNECQANVHTLRPQIEQEKERLKKEVDEVKPKYDMVTQLTSKHNLVKIQKEQATTNVQHLQWQVQRLETHQYDPNCKYCVENEFVKSARQAKERLATVGEMFAELNKQETELAMELAQFGDIPSRYQKMAEDVNQLKISLAMLQQAEATLATADSKVALAEAQLDTVRRQIKEYHNAREAIQHNNGIDAQIAHLQVLRSSIVATMRTLEGELRKLGGQIAVLETKKATMMDRIKEAEDLESQYEAYEYYLAAICRDGLPYKLIGEVLPAVESAVNNILAQMVEFTIALDVDGKNVNGKLIYDEERAWPLELASGMEKFISGLAIRVALMTISSLPKSNFLIVDEGIGTLDSDNLASISALFDVLKAQFSFVLLISHVDAVRDMTDRLLEIKRSDGYSKIWEE